MNVSVTVCSGLGDQLDKGQSASPAVDYIEALFAAELEEELKSDRDYTRVDKLVHACIYLLAPTGRIASCVLSHACRRSLGFGSVSGGDGR